MTVEPYEAVIASSVIASTYMATTDAVMTVFCAVGLIAHILTRYD